MDNTLYLNKPECFRTQDWVLGQTLTLYKPPGAFILESGKRLSPVTVAYETYGQLNSTGSNVILINHALTGSARAATPPREAQGSKKEPGWWNDLIGPGKAFDTNRYFVVCINTIGGCYGSTGPASLSPHTGRPYGMTFPVVTVKDMVRVQKKTLECLGVKKLLAVAGGSMGGMQSLEWAVAYPEMMKGVIPIGASGRFSAMAIAFNHSMRQAIMNDPSWLGGDYYGKTFPIDGMSLARMIGTITYKSMEAFTQRFDRQLMGGRKADYYDFHQYFEVESYLDYQGEKLVKRFDANTYLYLTKAMDLFDLGHNRSSYESALSRIKCKVRLVGISSDVLFPASEVRGLAVDLRRQGVETTYDELNSSLGHDGFLIEFDQMAPMIKNYLEEFESQE